MRQMVMKHKVKALKAISSHSLKTALQHKQLTGNNLSAYLTFRSFLESMYLKRKNR